MVEITRRRTALSVPCPCLVFVRIFRKIRSSVCRTKSCPVSAGQGRDRGVRTFGFLVRQRPAESIFRGVKWASLENLLESVSSKVQK